MIKEYNKKYWKCPFCKKGDLVEVSENLNYTAKTIYKVAYCDSDKKPNRILVEVDPEKIALISILFLDGKHVML